MSVICPPVVTDMNTYVPTKYGLFSVAKPFPETLDSHWINCGVQFESEACPTASTWVQACTSPSVKPMGARPSLKQFDPFVVHASWTCGAIGKTLEQHRDGAIRALACAEEREVEHSFYVGTSAATPKLVGSGATALNTTAAPVSLPAGIGMLEAAMGSVQCGEAVLHAPRDMGEMAARFNLTYGAGNMLRSAMGTPWAFGIGYGNVSPTGVVPPAGVSWIYITGSVYMQQGDVIINPPELDHAINFQTNQVILLAERPYLLAIDGCASFAVAVTTTQN